MRIMYSVYRNCDVHLYDKEFPRDVTRGERMFEGDAVKFYGISISRALYDPRERPFLLYTTGLIIDRERNVRILCLTAHFGTIRRKQRLKINLR